MAAPLVALRFAARFQCLGDRCEDTCCAGLQVPVEREAWTRIGAALNTTDADRQAFSAGFHAEDGAFRIAHVPGGGCGFLEGGLCGLHRRFGEAVLPDVCASFPRAVTHREAERLFSASLACPEAARLCLLQEDAVERIAVAESVLPRPRPHQPPPPSPFAAALEAAADQVHGLAMPLSSQLVTLAQLAMRGDPAALSPEGLQAAAQATEAQLSGLALPWEKVAALLCSLLHQRSAFAAQPRWTSLAERISARLSGADAIDAFALYRAARDAQGQRHGARLGLALRNYARYQWARFPVQEAPSPTAYVCRLALRVAMIRFLLALGAPAEDTPEAFDAALVECVQLAAKHLEQHPAFREQVDAVLACEEQDRFMKTLLFATFA